MEIFYEIEWERSPITSLTADLEGVVMYEEKEETEEERAGGGVAGCFPEIHDMPFNICCFLNLDKACEIKNGQ